MQKELHDGSFVDISVPTKMKNGKRYRLTQSEIDQKAIDDANNFQLTFAQDVKSYRDQKMKTVVSVNQPEDPNYLDAINDDENRNIITGIINMMTIANDGNMTINWKGVSGWQVGRLQDFQGLVMTGGLLTQKAFNAEKIILENHASSAYTDDAWKTDFDNEMED